MIRGARKLLAVLPFVVTPATADGVARTVSADDQRALDMHHTMLLMPGENLIEHFAPDGRPARVFSVLDVKGEKRSLVYMVTLRSNPGRYGTDWQIASFETAPSSGVFADTILDAPNGKSLVLQFAWATLHGKPETMLMAYEPIGSESLCGMVRTTYYRLVHEDKPLPVDRFKIFAQIDAMSQCVP